MIKRYYIADESDFGTLVKILEDISNIATDIECPTDDARKIVAKAKTGLFMLSKVTGANVNG